MLDAGADDENLVKFYLFWGILVCREFHHLPCHPVYRLDDLEHLVICDGAVFIYIVQLEGPYCRGQIDQY